MMDLLCPECGCPEVVVYDDGTCVCQGCEFVGNNIKRYFVMTVARFYDDHHTM